MIMSRHAAETERQASVVAAILQPPVSAQPRINARGAATKLCFVMIAARKAAEAMAAPRHVGLARNAARPPRLATVASRSGRQVKPQMARPLPVNASSDPPTAQHAG